MSWPAETKNTGKSRPKIPAERPYLTSYWKRAVCGDWMVVCTVRYEPVSLLFGQYQGDFRKKQGADYEKSQKCPQICSFSLSRQIREQGETGSIDRRKQGNEFPIQVRKSSERPSAQLTVWAGLIPKRTSDRRGRLNGKVRNVLVSRSVPTESRVLAPFHPSL